VYCFKVKKKLKKKIQAGILREFVFATFEAKMEHREVLVYKRGKARLDGPTESVRVSLDVIEQLGSLPLERAAATLGLSATSFKGACRKLGIQRWPYFAGRGLVRELLKPPAPCAAPAPRAVQDAATQTDVSFGGVYGCDPPALVDAEVHWEAHEDALGAWWTA
jgi:hypothetical protein